jgi:hypothetical protein
MLTCVMCRCLAAMATHLRSRGALSEAEVLYRRALTIRQDAGVVETYETVDILQKLGWVCEQQVGCTELQSHQGVGSLG